VLNGVPGTAMQAFAAQLNEKDFAAVITYERNAFGNDTGDIVQPADVQSVKNGGGIKPTMKTKQAAISGDKNA
jgi:cytochrome c oxidase subunit 2